MSNILDFKLFQNNCKDKKCFFHNILSRNCLKEWKQEKCYEKYLNKQIDVLNNNINKEDSKDLVFRKLLLERDKECLIWKILTDEEKKYIGDNFKYEYELLSNVLDTVHILSRNERPDLKHDMTNAFIGCRYFHTLLDGYKDLITREDMSKEQRDAWLQRIIKENNLG